MSGISIRYFRGRSGSAIIHRMNIARFRAMQWRLARSAVQSITRSKFRAYHVSYEILSSRWFSGPSASTRERGALDEKTNRVPWNLVSRKLRGGGSFSRDTARDRKQFRLNHACLSISTLDFHQAFSPFPSKYSILRSPLSIPLSPSPFHLTASYPPPWRGEIMANATTRLIRRLNSMLP